MRHRVTINVTNPDGLRNPVVKGRKQTVRSKLLNLLLGQKVGLLIITPGESVETVEIRELKEGGEGRGEHKHAVN